MAAEYDRFANTDGKEPRARRAYTHPELAHPTPTLLPFANPKKEGDDFIGQYAPGGGVDFNRTASCGINWACARYDASTGTFPSRDDR